MSIIVQINLQRMEHLLDVFRLPAEQPAQIAVNILFHRIRRNLAQQEIQLKLAVVHNIPVRTPLLSHRHTFPHLGKSFLQPFRLHFDAADYRPGIVTFIKLQIVKTFIYQSTKLLRAVLTDRKQ
ncbi:hypothetical protein D3C81_1816290 [compost metagenome]